MTDELALLDATSLAGLVRSGEVSAPELVDAAIARIERLNPAVNAVIHERFEKARSEAAGALAPGQFRGVPILLKDLGAAQAGEPYCEGTRFAKQAGYRATEDSFVTEHVRAAGFVILGRTNTPELGTTITTEPLAFGPSRNPWELDHTTGGSSGGAAAAVASGMVPIAHASDGGGSIRIPASCCGLVGLKPSRGRVSKGPAPAESWFGLSTDNALTRTVRDSAAMLDQLAGYMPGDTFLAPARRRPFAEEVGRDPGRLRVALMPQPAQEGFSSDRECDGAVHAAGALLESLGHDVSLGHPRSLEDPEYQGHFLGVITAAVAVALDQWSERLGREVSPEEFEPLNTLFTAMGRANSATNHVKSLLWLEGFRRRTVSFFGEGGYDLLVTPTIAKTPARIGELSNPVSGQQRVVETLQFTGQFNATGQPAISLPLSWSDGGLPIGVQLVADFGREDLLVNVASAIEAVAPWADRIPTVHASRS